ncbi:MAG: GAF domain-containing protein [Spartobacteria bacterium]|nr:GAF domain-containing protein [Spartobacteria bacterium]
MGCCSFVFFSAFLIIALVIALYITVRRYRLLRAERDELEQEKEVIFGFIHDAGEVFANAEGLDMEGMLTRVLFYAMRTTRAGAGAVYLLESDKQTLRNGAVSGIFPPLIGKVDAGLERAMSKSQHIQKLVRSQVIRKGEGLIGEVADIGMPILIEDPERDPRVPHYDLDYLKIHSILLVPMRFHQQVLGVIVVINRVDGQPFIQTDLNLLQAVADQASVSIHFAQLRESLNEKQRIDHDLDIARNIQMSLLPKTIPKIEGIELAAFNYPALEVGGDYYDFVEVDEKRIGIALADVSGKGISGAIMMSMCRSVLRSQAPGVTSPAKVLNGVNHLMRKDIADDMFVSMLYMILNIETHELAIARAGHERPILVPGDKSGLHVIESPGLAIGIGDEEAFGMITKDTVITLHPGDVVVTYTDGVTEAMNENEQEWGIDNFTEAIRVSADEGAHSVLNNVQQRLMRFVGETPQYDDTTLLALRVVR